MSILTDVLYRTNQSIANALLELDIHPTEIELEELLEDLAQCSHCNIHYWDYELIPDLDGLPICKFCSSYYGM